MDVHKITPFVRYALIALAGFASRGGWITDDLAAEMAADPLVVEIATSLIIAVPTLVWYLYSTSRAALVRRWK